MPGSPCCGSFLMPPDARPGSRTLPALPPCGRPDPVQQCQALLHNGLSVEYETTASHPDAESRVPQGSHAVRAVRETSRMGQTGTPGYTAPCVSGLRQARGAYDGTTRCGGA